MTKIRLHLFVLIMTLNVACVACAGHQAPVLVGQVGIATSQSIEVLSNASRQLREAGSLPAAVDVSVQEKLTVINSKLVPLPDILRTIDRLQVANDPATLYVDRAISILEIVGQDLSVVIAGVPVSAATGKLLDLVRAAQATVQTTLVEVAKIKGAE